jgi:hypothetical protein
VQIPDAPTKPVKKEVKEVVLKAVMTNDEMTGREGTYFKITEVDKVYDEDIDIYRLDPDTGKKMLLAKFRKNVIPKELIKRGWEAFYQTAAPSRNRGAAAGPIRATGAYWKKRKPTDINRWSAREVLNGVVSKMRVNNNVFSSVLGYFDATPFMKLPCRLTTYTTTHFKHYKHGLPFVSALDHCFKKLIPENWKKQKAAADEKPLLRIEDTAFSSVTVNRNFRTGLHMDDGDFKDGFGNLSVIERGSYHGGYTLFPQYGIGFNVRTGDFLAMDVHQWHCNTKLYETAEDKAANKGLPNIHRDKVETGTLGVEMPFSRVSFVCYLREGLRNCNNGETKDYFKEIGFNPRNLTLRKK